VQWLGFADLLDAQRLHVMASIGLTPKRWLLPVAALLITAGQPQEIQRTFPGALGVSFTE